MSKIMFGSPLLTINASGKLTPMSGTKMLLYMDINLSLS